MLNIGVTGVVMVSIDVSTAFSILRRFISVCPICHADALVEYHPGTSGDTWLVREHCTHLLYTGGMSQWVGDVCVFSARHVLGDVKSWAVQN